MKRRTHIYMDYRQVMLGYTLKSLLLAPCTYSSDKGLIIAKLLSPSSMATVNFKTFMGTCFL